MRTHLNEEEFNKFKLTYKKSSNDTNIDENDNVLRHLDYRTQKPNKQFTMYCDLCKWKFITAKNISKHFSNQHKNINAQLCNTVR